MSEQVKVYLPQIIGGGYKKFWSDKSRYRVLMGGKASKKSTTTALNYIYRLMKYKSSNLLVVRSVLNTHKDSTFAQLKWAQEKLQVSHLWRNTVSPLEMTYIPTGQKILFRGFDDVLKIASTTVPTGSLCWVWVEEAFELEHESDFDKLDLSLPRGELAEPLFKQTTLTFNPWSAEHWLKKRFFDVKDNPQISTYCVNYLKNEFLDDADRAVFERLKQTNYRKYAVAGLGQWGIAEGLVFENWQVLEFDEKTLGADDNTQHNYRAFFGLDYGYTNDPTAFICFYANPVTRQIFIFDEHYERKMLNCDIAEMIKRKGYTKERIRADAAEPKSNDDLRRLGIIRISPSVKGRDSILNGIDKISEYKIFVHPRCKNTIKELCSYRYSAAKSDNGKILPVDTDNHLMDALRYAFFDVRFFKPAEKTRPKKSNGLTTADISSSWGG